MYALDHSEKEVIAGPITLWGDAPVTKYRADDGRTFWAYNGMEVFYEDERLYAALDEIWRQRRAMESLLAHITK